MRTTVLDSNSLEHSFTSLQTNKPHILIRAHWPFKSAHKVIKSNPLLLVSEEVTLKNPFSLILGPSPEFSYIYRKWVNCSDTLPPLATPHQNPQQVWRLRNEFINASQAAMCWSSSIRDWDAECTSNILGALPQPWIAW